MPTNCLIFEIQQLEDTEKTPIPQQKEQEEKANLSEKNGLLTTIQSKPGNHTMKMVEDTKNSISYLDRIAVELNSSSTILLHSRPIAVEKQIIKTQKTIKINTKRKHSNHTYLRFRWPRARFVQ